MGYEASKMSERKWGIFYRLNQTTSFYQNVSYPTKREAVATAAMLNREESSTQKGA